MGVTLSLSKGERRPLPACFVPIGIGTARQPIIEIMRDSLLIKAAFSEKTERPPVWMMRQAGRFMPEYWEIKNKYSFLEMCKTPEIAADVTMLPVDLLGIDAAILFSDILVTGEAMGGDLSFTQNVGPKFANPVRNQAGVDALQTEVGDKLQYVADAIKVIQ